MKKSTIAALVAGTALAAFTYGCGGDNTTNAPANAGNAAATPRPTVAATPMATPAANTSTTTTNTSTTTTTNTSTTNTRPAANASPAR